MLYNFNLNLFNLIHGFAGRYPWLDWLGIFCAKNLQYEVGLLVLIYAYRNRKYWIEILVLPILAAGVSRGILVTAIRFFYHHPRPFSALNFTPLIPEESYSFPSGHATFLFALATGIYFFNKRMGIVVGIIALIISVARIYVGVHWPLDILGGAILGIATAWLIENIYQKYKTKIG